MPQQWVQWSITDWCTIKCRATGLSCIYLSVKLPIFTKQVVGLKAEWRETDTDRLNFPFCIFFTAVCKAAHSSSLWYSPQQRCLWDWRTATKPCSRQETSASCCRAFWTDVCTKGQTDILIKSVQPISNKLCCSNYHKHVCCDWGLHFWDRYELRLHVARPLWVLHVHWLWSWKSVKHR